MAVLFGILGVGGYVFLTYITKSIILSFYEYEELTLGVLANIDTFTAPIIAAVICMIASFMDHETDDDILWYALVLGIGTALFYYLPYSTGIVILCNLIWAGCVFVAIFRCTSFRMTP